MRIFLLLATILTVCSCSRSYKFVDYLKPKENVSYTYDCEFHREGQKDTLFEVIEVVYKPYMVEGKKALYSTKKRDLEKQNPIVGTSNFLFSIMLFEGNSVQIAPLFWKKDLKNLKLASFTEKFPVRVKQKDKITYEQAGKTIVLTDFTTEDLKTKHLGVIKGCLAFKKIVKREGSNDKIAYVWLHKKHGLVKWIRKTGRIEELKAFPAK